MDRTEQQAAGTHPAPCARHCEANAFQIEIRGLKAAYASACEAGKKLAQQALKAERERDALAAELKKAREQEPVAWFAYSDESGYHKFLTLQDATECAHEWLAESRAEALQDGEWSKEAESIEFGAILGCTTETKGETDGEGWVDYQLTRPDPVPARELTDETIQRHWDEACKDTTQTPGWSRHIRFARAIERYLKGEGK